MIFRAVVAIVLLVSATADETKGDVTFWMKNVTLRCPWNGEWFKGVTQVASTKKTLSTFNYEYNTGSKDLLYCKDDKGNKYFFYIQGKACENCFELDGYIYAVVIVADVVGTVVVMAIVYKCTKKIAAATHPKASTSNPKVPIHNSSEYETLNLNTRASEYSTVVNRMG
ncbi:T-cell surface glycoprotein CD3 epsilon chain-like [Eucyclogobius newberryi]|uniref:T-cell surface glycoprotein CD3 epsilon chain-like n=1 Tax=Eucyclogobius newberryi TaxID=166745 RepID=UPI003B5BE8BE